MAHQKRMTTLDKLSEDCGIRKKFIAEKLGIKKQTLHRADLYGLSEEKRILVDGVLREVIQGLRDFRKELRETT